MKLNYLLIGLLFFMMPNLQAQQYFEAGNNYNDDQKGIVYDQEFTVDFKLLTNGFSLGAHVGKLKTYYLTRFYSFEIGDLKHPKEYRQSFGFQIQTTNRVSRSFILGKQNTFLALRGGIGEKRYLSEKAKRKGLSVGITYEGGPTIGLLKPYYLELIITESNNPTSYYISSEKYTEENANLFLNQRAIYGSSGFAKGLNEIRVVPGAHAKFAMHFDWGAFDEFVKAFEAGIQADFFFGKVPIMVESPELENVKNSSFFLNLYLNLQLGKRK